MPAGQWALGNARDEFIIYSRSPSPIALDLITSKGPLTVHWIDPRNGSLLMKQQHNRDTMDTALKSPTSGPVVAWVTRSP
jgi:hypothetical protein